MFRRKEDSLFDNVTDSNQGPAESATVINSPQSAQPQSSPVASSSSNGSSPLYGSASSSASAARPAASTASFRAPSAPIGGELTRNRMPEAKSNIASGLSSSPNASSGNTEKNKSTGGVRRVLTVGNDILLKGEIATCDRLVIEGKVDATLNDVHTVEIAESGSFKGSAHIEDAEISGLFEGDLVVRGRLVIYATGKVRGKITYGEIEIERGGELSGEIKTSTGAGNQAMAPRPPRQKEKDAVAA